MSLIVLLAVFAIVLFTSFLSGVFGMAGGMILMGALLLFVPVPAAMILHGITQMTSNGWRAVMWRARIDFRIVLRYLIGLAAASVLFSAISFIPDQRVIFLVLGLIPFISFVAPTYIVPQAGQRGGAEICGFICTALQFLSGVSGPTLDIFFVKSLIDRRVVVATKAACQVITHLAKLIYFGFLVTGDNAEILHPLVIGVAMGTAILGTMLSRSVLERLSDHNFRKYTQAIVMAIGVVYLGRFLMHVA